MDIADLEKAEQQIDLFIERRAREVRDADAVEDLWAEQERRERARRREANRADWIAYHAHMNAVHSSIAADHADRRSRLLLEAEYDGPQEAA